MVTKADWFLAKVAAKHNHCHATALANTLECCSKQHRVHAMQKHKKPQQQYICHHSHA